MKRKEDNFWDFFDLLEPWLRERFKREMGLFGASELIEVIASVGGLNAAPAVEGAERDLFVVRAEIGGLGASVYCCSSSTPRTGTCCRYVTPATPPTR